MANRYWRGGSGTWGSTTTNWSATSGGAGGASVPTAADSVFFNLSGTYTVTFAAGTNFNCLDFTVSAGNVTFVQAASMNLTVAGNFSILSNTVFNAAGGTGTLNFFNTGGKTAGTNGAAVGLNVIFGNSSSSSITLSSAFNVKSPGTTTLTFGTLNLNGFNLTSNYFDSSNTNTRTLAFGSGNIITPALYCPNVSNMTLTKTTGAVICDTPGASYNFGNSSTGGYTVGTSGAPNLTFTGAGSTTISTTITSNTTAYYYAYWDTIDFGSTAAKITTGLDNQSMQIYPGWPILCKSLILNSSVDITTNSIGFTQYNTGTITSNGGTFYTLSMSSNSNLTLLDSLTCGWYGYFNHAGTLNLNGFNITTPKFYSSGTSTRTINFDTGNIELTNGTGTGTVVALDCTTATGFTWTGTGGFTVGALTSGITRTFTFGTTGGSTSNAPNLSVTSGSIGPSITSGSWFNVLNFTGSTAGTNTTSLNLNGLVLGSGTYTNLTPTMRGAGTITSNGKTLPSLTILSSGTTTLGSALTTTGAVSIQSGTLDLTGFTMTTPSVTSTTSSARSITGAGIINVSGAWTISTGTNFTGSNYTINMTSASAKTFAGGSGSYGSLVQAGAGVLTISGSNTFADISATTRPSTIIFTAGTTQTVAYFTLSGTLGNLVTINSSTAGTQFNLSKVAGAVNASYLNIQDSNVTGGATWSAYNGTNTNSGNNTGWAFVYVPPSITGQFMAFF
jgi:hypothetical protein